MSGEKKTCFAINHPNLAPSWGCHECRTMNGNQRSECKQCGHVRCDNPAEIIVPIREEGGIRMVPVKQQADKKKAN